MTVLPSLSLVTAGSLGAAGAVEPDAAGNGEGLAVASALLAGDKPPFATLATGGGVGRSGAAAADPLEASPALADGLLHAATAIASAAHFVHRLADIRGPRS